MMIRCSEKHRQECLDYLNSDPVMNLFLIGDIQQYGFDHGFQTVFVDKDEQVHAVYLVYYDGLLISAAKGRVDAAFVEKLVDEYGIRVIQGRQEVIDELPSISWRRQQCVFSRMGEFHPLPQGDFEIRRAQPQDAPAIAQLLQEVFGRPQAVQPLRRQIETGAGRHLLIEQNGILYCQANSTAETPRAAMIAGVATRADHRRQGMAKAVVSQLCQQLLDEGKTPCLFTDSEEAAALYRRLGFVPAGSWVMLLK